MAQITVFSGSERRRRWSDEQRLQILAEAFAPGACPTEVARRHENSTGQLYTWRSKLAVGAVMPSPDDTHALGFAEAMVIEDRERAVPVWALPSSLICPEVAASPSFPLHHRRWRQPY